MSTDERRKGRKARGVSLGAGIGMVFGAALGNPGVGLVLGAAAGLALEVLSGGSSGGDSD